MIVERRPRRSEASPPDCRDVRCLCGSLLARVTPHGVQLKCRRCKRMMLIPLAGGPPTGRAPPT